MENRKKVVSRRAVLGISAAGALVASGVGGAVALSKVERSVPDKLLSPLRPGSTLGRWTVLKIGPRQHGAIEVEMQARNESPFVLEIVALDPAPKATTPPGRTRYLAIHVRNRGDGASRTDENQGLAAMALAEVIAANESAESADGLLTLAERLEKHADILYSEG